MVPTSSAPSFTPLGGLEVPPPPIREEISTCPDFLRTKTKRLLFTSPIKGLMGSTSPGPRNPPRWPPPGHMGTWEVETQFQLDFHGTKSKRTIMAYNMAYNKILAQKVPPCDHRPTPSSIHAQGPLAKGGITLVEVQGDNPFYLV